MKVTGSRNHIRLINGSSYLVMAWVAADNGINLDILWRKWWPNICTLNKGDAITVLYSTPVINILSSSMLRNYTRICYLSGGKKRWREFTNGVTIEWLVGIYFMEFHLIIHLFIGRNHFCMTKLFPCRRGYSIHIKTKVYLRTYV